MPTYLRQLHVTLHDFNELLPPFANVKKEHENYRTFFMTLDLYGLPQECATTSDQILGSLVNNAMIPTSVAFLRIP